MLNKNSAAKPSDDEQRQQQRQQSQPETSALLVSQASKGSMSSHKLDDNNVVSSNGDHRDIERGAHNSSSSEDEDDRLLMLAIKDAQFIQPDLSLFTMRFKSNEESDFQAYLMGMNTTSPSLSSTHKPSAAAAATTNHHHVKSSKFSNSLRIWAHPQNMLFVSVLLAVCINLCLSTAYFLSFVVASMSAIEYKLTSAYQRDFLIIVAIFLLVCLIQFAFLFLNFWTCNKAMKKRQQRIVHESNSVATTEFSGIICSFFHVIYHVLLRFSIKMPFVSSRKPFK